ncbi:MAG: hypothetical protein KA715_02310 [Xanthomonadaceae bacterium]|nr:hypothetical protein [Xanthomonadaceae bacterium]
MQKLSLSLLLLTLVSCGNVVTNSTTTPGCQSGTVLILIGDNFFQPLCGCQEIAGMTTPPASSTLSCTFSAGATVIFDFTGTQQVHQIRFAVGSSIADSPLYDLRRTPGLTTYGFSVPTAGTYTFRDSINPTLSGSLIAL